MSTPSAPPEANCGSSITATCKGKTIPMTPTGWQQMVNEVVDALVFIIDILPDLMADQFTFNMFRATVAFQCAIKSGGVNFWYLIGALYHAAKQFGQEKQVVDLLDEYYPYVCTCLEDRDAIEKWLKESGASEAVKPKEKRIKACSDDVQQAKAASS